MPTVIPYQDATSELFNAYRTMQEVQQSAQKIAMDQALADQHIKSAQTIDQMNQQRLQIEQQQTKEFTSPEGISARQRAQDTALGQGDANLVGTQLSNEFRQQLNPLQITQQIQAARQARIHADASQQELNDLQSKLGDEKQMRTLAIQATKYKNLSEYGMDGHTAELMGQLKGAELAQQLAQLPETFKARSAALQAGVKELEMKPQMDIAKMLTEAGTVANGPYGPGVAKAIYKDVPGMEGLQNIPDDLMRQGSDPKKQLFSQMVALYKDPATKDEAKQAIIDTISHDFLPKDYKAPTANERSMAEIMKTPIDESALKNARKVAEELLNKSSYDTASGKLTAPGFFDAEQPVKGSMQKVTEKTPTTGLPQGAQFSQSPTQTPVSITPTKSSVQTITQKDQPVSSLPSKSLQDSMKVFDQVEQRISSDLETSKKSFQSNKKDEKVGLLGDTTDESYAISNTDSKIYNMADRAKREQANRDNSATGMASDPLVSTMPKDFQDIVSANFARDKSATVAQEARYRTALSQLARGYKEAGKNGLKQMWQIVGQKYKANTSSGITLEQGRALAAIVMHYGDQ